MSENEDTRRSLIPYAIMAFFVVIAIANAVFVYYAIKTHPGLETENAYEKGLAYNATLAGAKASAALGWRGEIVIPPGDEGVIEIRIVDRDGLPQTGLAVTALAVWPVKEGFDTPVSFEAAGGVYRAEAHLPMKGRWELRVTAANDSGAVFHFSQRVML